MAEEAKTGVTISKGREVAKTAPARALTPFEEMDRMLDRFFEGALPRGWLRPLRWERPLLGELTAAEARMPHVDLVERDEEVVLRAEVPGVEKKDIDVSITGNSVTIKGQTRHEEKEEKGEYYRCEISRGAFSRTVALPAPVDPDRANASFKDGILEITLPKVEKAKRRTLKLD
jgi:HSP20 family protein